MDSKKMLNRRYFTGFEAGEAKTATRRVVGKRNEQRYVFLS